MVRDSPSSMNGADWLVQVPLSQLIALQSLPQELDKLRNENKLLMNRIEGLHRTLYDTIELVGDLRRTINVPAKRTA